MGYPASRCGAEFSKECVARLLESGHVVLNCSVNELKVDSQGAVNRDIAKSGDCSPVHVGPPNPEVIAQAPGRLSHGLEVIGICLWGRRGNQSAGRPADPPRARCRAVPAAGGSPRLERSLPHAALGCQDGRWAGPGWLRAQTSPPGGGVCPSGRSPPWEGEWIRRQSMFRGGRRTRGGPFYVTAGGPNDSKYSRNQRPLLPRRRGLAGADLSSSGGESSPGHAAVGQISVHAIVDTQILAHLRGATDKTHPLLFEHAAAPGGGRAVLLYLCLTSGSILWLIRKPPAAGRRA
jgi:hypothetical protein